VNAPPSPVPVLLLLLLFPVLLLLLIPELVGMSVAMLVGESVGGVVTAGSQVMLFLIYKIILNNVLQYTPKILIQK